MDFEKKLDKKFEEIEQELERKTRDIEERTQRKYDEIERRMSGDEPEESPRAAAPEQSQMPVSEQGTDQVKDKSHKTDLPEGARGLVHEQERRSLVVPNGAEIEQAWAFVSRSPHVAENPQYKRRVQGANFLLDMENAVVNAFATDHPMKWPDGTVLEGPTVVFLGGVANALCLTATGLALQRCIRQAELRHGRGKARNVPSPLKITVTQVGKMFVAREGQLPLEAASQIFEHTLLPVLREVNATGEEDYAHYAPSFRFSLYMAPIAHEIGHIAYGHTLGKSSTYTVSREQEHNADSFASQVLSVCPYSEYHFLAQALVMIVFAWMGHAAGQKQVETHPRNIDRFRQLFRDADNRAEQEAQETFGITRKDLEDLLPPV